MSTHLIKAARVLHEHILDDFFWAAIEFWSFEDGMGHFVAMPFISLNLFLYPARS